MIGRFFQRLALAAFPVLTIIVLVNYFVDPANTLHNGEYEQQIAKGLLENSNIGITTNYNERLLQRYIIDDMSVVPDGIVIGSSRIMSIPTSSLGLRRGFCNGVSGAVIEDMISIVGMYDRRGMLPKSVFIGIDPWLFNEFHGDTRYIELLEEYNHFVGKLNLESIPSSIQSNGWLEKIKQALSLSYFQASLASVSTIGKDRPVPLKTTELDPDNNTKLPDGSIIYNKEYREKAVELVRESVVQACDGREIYHSQNYTGFSSKIIHQFTGLVEYLKRQRYCCYIHFASAASFVL